MGGRVGRPADQRTGPGTLGGRADGGEQWADERTGGQRRAKARTGWRTGGLADWRTGGRADDGFPKVKLPI